MKVRFPLGILMAGHLHTFPNTSCSSLATTLRS